MEEKKKEEKTEKEIKKDKKEKEVKEDKKEDKKTKSEKEKEKAKAKLKNIKITRKSEKKEENKLKKFFSSYQFLYSVFGILLLAVIILSVLVYREKHTTKNAKADLVYPVIYKGTQNGIKIDMPALYDKGKYTIIITNEHNRKVNDVELDYNLLITKESDSKIKVVKDGSDKNLMVDQESTRIEGETLKANKRQEDKYIITVEGSKPKKGDTIYLEVNS